MKKNEGFCQKNLLNQWQIQNSSRGILSGQIRFSWDQVLYQAGFVFGCSAFNSLAAHALHGQPQGLTRLTFSFQIIVLELFLPPYSLGDLNINQQLRDWGGRVSTAMIFSGVYFPKNSTSNRQSLCCRSQFRRTCYKPGLFRWP